MVGLAAALYLTVAAATIHSVYAGGGDPHTLGEKVVEYAELVPADFLLLTLALLRARRDAIEPLFFAVAVVLLLLLPFFPFGPNNDLSLYGSIPALAAIMFATIDGWARPVRIGGSGVVVTAILLLGALTPLSQIYRAVSWPTWKPNLHRSVVDAAGGASPNYLASLNDNALLMRLLRGPNQP